MTKYECKSLSLSQKIRHAEDPTYDLLIGVVNELELGPDAKAIVFFLSQSRAFDQAALAIVPERYLIADMHETFSFAGLNRRLKTGWYVAIEGPQQVFAEAKHKSLGLAVCLALVLAYQEVE